MANGLSSETDAVVRRAIGELERNVTLAQDRHGEAGLAPGQPRRPPAVPSTDAIRAARTEMSGGFLIAALALVLSGAVILISVLAHWHGVGVGWIFIALWAVALLFASIGVSARRRLKQIDARRRSPQDEVRDGRASVPRADGSPSNTLQSRPGAVRGWSPRQRFAAVLVLALAVAAGLGLYHTVARPRLPAGPAIIPPTVTTPSPIVPSYIAPPRGAPSLGLASESTYVTDCESSNPDVFASRDPGAFCQCVYNNIVAQTPSRLVAHQVLASEKDPYGMETFMAESTCIGTP